MIPFISSANVWRICAMTSCARFVFWLRMFPTLCRGRSTPKFGYVSPKRTILEPVATRAELWSHQRGKKPPTCWNIWPHSMQLLCTNVFDTLLSDGGNSHGGAGGTASSVSKVPGNAGLSSLTYWAWQSHFSGFCHALPPHIVFLSLLPFLSKTIERAVFKQVTDYLSQNSFLDPNQSV